MEFRPTTGFLLGLLIVLVLTWLTGCTVTYGKRDFIGLRASDIPRDLNYSDPLRWDYNAPGARDYDAPYQNRTYRYSNENPQSYYYNGPLGYHPNPKYCREVETHQHGDKRFHGSWLDYKTFRHIILE